MRQLTVISGKGGTGKTTITAAFASMAKNAVFADCDCDAPDLQLILKPKVVGKEEYIGSAVAIKKTNCSKCGKCREVCRFGAIDNEIKIIKAKCEGCGACAFVCPENAIEMKKEKTGTIYRSLTRFGPLIHAELRIGEEASGKLVNRVRKKAKELASGEGLIIIDGSPGIGCPVISSITGVDAVLVVAEPTVTGIYDMERALEVAEHFEIPAMVCINKHNINKEKTKEIEEFCRTRGVPVVGKLPYDDVATRAMINEQTVIEYSNSELSKSLKEIWGKIESTLS
ncbi:(4Fe-4S)-binding protein [candidate division MSBL1 archaeon SCGC-AAA261D19]|uniref:(4Fe-4S)-binding protein n=1 Tax=candidate division MSBL1 archaeon SCGC-AAA261D19 TaxID=1698273 RepID=A0A133V3X5_9EURY|nr:(4Fe-4S)-binding protein [candidate division MSBL1 archaeon SCGC-AAA261D19]